MKTLAYYKMLLMYILVFSVLAVQVLGQQSNGSLNNVSTLLPLEKKTRVIVPSPVEKALEEETQSNIIAGEVKVLSNCQLVYSTSVKAQIYRWHVTGGVIIDGSGTSSITVKWTDAGAGSIYLETINYYKKITSKPLNVKISQCKITVEQDGGEVRIKEISECPQCFENCELEIFNLMNHTLIYKDKFTMDNLDYNPGVIYTGKLLAGAYIYTLKFNRNYSKVSDTFEILNH